MKTIRTMPHAQARASLALAFLLAVACMLCALVAAPPNAALADDADPGSGTPSLTIVVQHEDEDTGDMVEIDGVQYAIYQVAKFGAGNAYETLGGYSSVDVDFNRNITTREMLVAAEDMAKLAKNQVATAKGTTGDDGTVKFADLDKGVYLVVQTGRTGYAEEFSIMPPFLINVPRYEDGTEELDVVASPKPEFDPEWHKEEVPPKDPYGPKHDNPGEPTPPDSDIPGKPGNPSRSGTPSSSSHTTPPRTGDTLDMGMVGLGAAVGLGAMLVAIYAARKRRDEKE